MYETLLFIVETIRVFLGISYEFYYLMLKEDRWKLYEEGKYT